MRRIISALQEQAGVSDHRAKARRSKTGHELRRYGLRASALSRNESGITNDSCERTRLRRMLRMSETRRLTESATVRVSADELAVIAEKAARANVSIGGYFRAAALERRMPTQRPELLRGLADIGRLCGLLETALRTADDALRAHVIDALAAARAVADELRRR